MGIPPLASGQWLVVLQWTTLLLLHTVIAELPGYAHTVCPPPQETSGAVCRECINDSSCNQGPSTSFLLIRGSFTQLCQDVNCTRMTVAISISSTNLQQLTEEDGCFKPGDNWDNCQLKLISGLQEFQFYLGYMQNQFPTLEANRKVQEISDRIRIVLHLLRNEVNDPDLIPPNPTANAVLKQKLMSQDEKTKLTMIQLILYYLGEFMDYTVRAVLKHNSSV
ncbi:interleukin-6-like [Ctenodactylus gundi]